MEYKRADFSCSLGGRDGTALSPLLVKIIANFGDLHENFGQSPNFYTFCLAVATSDEFFHSATHIFAILSHVHTQTFVL